jgi:hypothetical protein
MNSDVTNAATALVAPKLLGNFKFRWLVYGAAAYYGLKYLSSRGIFPKQTGAALDLIDKGIDVAKQQVGFGNIADTASSAINRH